MIRILFGVSAPVARLEWSVYKGASGVKEDFTGANVFFWMIGAGNRFLVDCTTEDGMIKAVIPSMLPEGVYDLRAMWIKEENCCKRSMSEVENAFGVTYDPEEATPVVGDSCTIKVKSCTATYGYDGLSAYEMSVLKGKTTMSEEEWIVYQNGIPAEVSEQLDGRFLQSFGNEEQKGISQKKLTEDRTERMEAEAGLQGQITNITNGTTDIIDRNLHLSQTQINQIVLGGSIAVSLSATPSPIFVGEQRTISLGANISTPADTITIKKGDTVISTGSGTSVGGSDTITPSSAGNTNYTAEFVLGGLTKTADKAVVAVYPIRTGSGVNYVEGTPISTPKTSPAGTYNITVSANGQYVWFNVPATMSINGATMGGFDFPFENPTNVTIGGVAYKSYRSSNTYDAESLTIVIL